MTNTFDGQDVQASWTTLPLPQQNASHTQKPYAAWPDEEFGVFTCKALCLVVASRFDKRFRCSNVSLSIAAWASVGRFVMLEEGPSGGVGGLSGTCFDPVNLQSKLVSHVSLGRGMLHQ